MKPQSIRITKVVRGIALFASLSGTVSLTHAGEAASGANQTIATSEYAQWCGREDRNRISSATGLADSFEEVSTNKFADCTHLRNVKWVVPLFDPAPTYVSFQVFGSPVVAGGKVYLGGCPKNAGDNKALGVLLCFRESDGELLWKLRSPFIHIYDNPRGIMSTPAVEGGRVYVLGQIGEVLCLNANGLANGNTGLFHDEESWLALDRKVIKNEMTSDGRRIVEYSAGTPVKLEKNDADIIWRYDMVTNICWWGHSGAAGSILIHGDYLIVPTCSDWCDATVDRLEVELSEPEMSISQPDCFG